ncbi:MAG TPA: hypothetical protein VJ751_02510 [Pyrinomonadaceae bacterium]|jgi:hypothetical protein|nr:hypothetical protein [Pyrinomonadaceae bacterium]
MDYTNYDNVKHAELTQSYKSGANWFYWIAGLTIVTSLIAFGGGGIRFLIGLGITQIIDGVAEAISADGGGVAKVVALVLSLLISGVFIIFGWLANKKSLGAYIVGMVLFGLDGLLSAMFQDWIGVIAHAVILFFLFRGFQAGRELVSLEKTMAQGPPQAEVAT